MHSLEDVREFCRRQKRGKRKLILDTNLLILLFVGVCDRDMVAQCEATRKYNCDHCDLLEEIFRYFRTEILITPHIIAELSNLSLMKVPEHKKQHYFRELIHRLQYFKEEQTTLGDLLGSELKIIIRFGLPDIGIIETARKLGAVILTDDMRLAEYSFYLGIPCIQFGSVVGNEMIRTH